MKTKLAIILLLIIFLSCASNQIPLPKDIDHALLIVPVIFMDGEDISARKKLKDYEFNLYFENREKPLYVGIKNKISIKDQLKPGMHRLVKIKQNHIQKFHDFSILFETRSNTITIAPFTIAIANFEVIKNEKYYSSQKYEWESYSFSWGLVDTSKKIYYEIVDELIAHENYSKWKLLSYEDMNNK